MYSHHCYPFPLQFSALLLPPHPVAFRHHPVTRLRALDVDRGRDSCEFNQIIPNQRTTPERYKKYRITPAVTRNE